MLKQSKWNQMKFIKLDKKENLIWFLARCKPSEFSLDKQKVPGWIGFCHEVLIPTHDDKHLSKTIYLPSIDQPSKKVSIVQEVLCQVKEKANVLKNKKANLALNHAIYCNGLEVIMGPKNLEVLNFTNL